MLLLLIELNISFLIATNITSTVLNYTFTTHIKCSFIHCKHFV